MKRDIDIFCKLLLLFCFIAIAGKAAAYTFEQGGIYYFTSGNMAVVTFKDTDYDSYSGHVTVPASVTHNGTTYQVTAVGNSAFKECYELTAVDLPSTITSIGNYAFENCEGLTNLNMPSSLTSIGQSAFYRCTSLNNLVIIRSVFVHL